MTISVELYNRYAVLQPPYPRDEVRKFFRYYVPGARYSIAFQRGWNGYKYLMKGHTVPSGLYLAQRDKIEEKLDIRFIETDSLLHPKIRGDNQPPPITPHKFQRETVRSLIQSRVGGLVLNATGTGKTAIIGLYFRRLKGSAVFVVDELGLLEQSCTELSKITEEQVGTIGDSLYAPQRLTCATVQTLAKHRSDRNFKRWFDSLDVVVIDEIHQALNKSNFSVVAATKAKRVFGLTATLGLRRQYVRVPAWALAGPVLYRYPIERGQEEGLLCQSGAIQVVFQGEDIPGPFSLVYDAAIVDNQIRNDLTAQLAALGVHHGRRIIILVERLRHLDLLSDKLSELGLRHEIVCGQTQKSVRVRFKEQMEKGQLSLILANRVFFKGINIPSLDMIVDATAGKSNESTLQKFGRGVRARKGKDGLLYFDIGDTGNRFEVAAKARRRALKKAGIKIVKFRGPPRAAYRRAVKLLHKSRGETDDKL